jgi:hypothetical protein
VSDITDSVVFDTFNIWIRDEREIDKKRSQDRNHRPKNWNYSKYPQSLTASGFPNSAAVLSVTHWESLHTAFILISEEP